jgi:hypothetical protein
MPVTARSVLWLIWLCLLARGAFYAVLLPLWEGYDEWAHVAYVQLLASGQGLPVLGRTVISRETAQSLELTPLPYGHPSMTGTRLAHDDYWRLSDRERAARQHALHSLPREWSASPALQHILNHEAQQPPLYYLMLAPVQLAAGGLALPARVLLMRLMSLLVASLTIPLAYVAARRVLGSEVLATGVAAVIASMPGFLMSASRVGNDGLSTTIFTALVCVLLGGWGPWLAGTLLGVGLLTKAYFLTAIPALVMIFAWRFLRDAGGRGRIAMDAAKTLLAAAAISGWWYWRNYALTGSWSGLQQVVARGRISPWDLVSRVPEVNWARFFDIAFLSHVWCGNWSFLQLRSWMYRLFAWIVVVAAVGLAQRLWRAKGERTHLAALASVYGFFWLGLCYHELTFFVLGLFSGAGWYVCAVIIAEVLLVVSGLQVLCPARHHSWLPAMAAGLYAALDLYATHFLLLPYYTGMVAHKPGGGLAAFQVGEFTKLPAMLERLAAPAPLAFAMWLCFVVATLALPLLAARGHSESRLRDSGTA